MCECNVKRFRFRFSFLEFFHNVWSSGVTFEVGVCKCQYIRRTPNAHFTISFCLFVDLCFNFCFYSILGCSFASTSFHFVLFSISLIHLTIIYLKVPMQCRCQNYLYMQISISFVSQVLSEVCVCT